MRLTLFSAALLATGITSAAVPVDGWYTSVFGGYTYVPDNVRLYTFFGNFINSSSFNSGYNAGGRVGYQSNPMRYEVEYTYIHANARYFKVNFIGQTGVTGYSSGNLAMANVYYDTPEVLPSVVPFLGFGIGYAYIQDRLNSISPQGYATFLSVNENAFAVQGTAGFTYNFAENYAMNLAYRYVSTTSTSNNLGLRYQAHIANAGVVYHFDNGSYK